MQRRPLPRIASALALAAVLSGLIVQPASASAAGAPLPGSVALPQTYVEGTDPAAALYNPLVVNQFNLTMPPSTIAGLTSPNVNSDNEGPYLPATLNATVNGQVYGPMAVGVHLKGAWGSWRDINGKSGFKIKIDFVDKKARFFGVSKLTLNNMVQDPSFLHETMAYRIFRAVGIAAPRTGFANVSVNGVNYGLHLNVETLDTEMLARFIVKPNHIYKAGVPTFADLADGQEPGFAVDYGKADDKSDLEKLITANDANPLTDWYDKVSQVADLKEMTLDWATELFTGHWDGYVHNRNNYYLVSDSAGRFIMLPWGTDQTFYGGVDYFSNEGLLFTNCLASKPCLALYQQALAKVIHKANSLNILPMTHAVAEAISTAALADTRKEFGNDVIAGYQDGARNTFLAQISSGLSIIAPFDTEMVTFGNANYGFIDPTETLYVPAKTKSITLQGIPYSPNALTATANLMLHSGINTANLSIQNLVGSNSQSFIVKVYRRSQKSSSEKVSFLPKAKTLTAKGSTALASLAGRLAIGQQIEIQLIFGQGAAGYKAAIALAKTRANQLSDQLSKLGVQPIKITYGLNTSLTRDQGLIKVSYQG
jgi:hypothetical protein